jgi:hypothetical protein
VPRLTEAVIHTNPREEGTDVHHAALAHHFPRRVADGPVRSPRDHDPDRGDTPDGPRPPAR